MASITFNDGVAATLDNGLTAIASGAASRFAGWTPFTRKVGHSAHSLATGARSMFTFRTEYGATFELRELPAASLSVALRLKRHLEGGGTCTVNTGDSAARSYATCGLNDGASVGISPQDMQQFTYTVSLSLINLGAAADMLCEY
jgi:hypothetical protein